MRLPNTRYKHRSYYQVGTNSNAQGRQREDSYQTASNNVVSDRVVTREGYQYDDALIANPRTCTNLSFTETVNGIVNFRNYGAMVASPDIVPRVVSPPDTISGFTNAIAYFKDQDTYNVTIWVAYGDPVELDGTILQLYDSDKEQVFQKGLIFFSEYGFPVQVGEVGVIAGERREGSCCGEGRRGGRVEGRRPLSLSLSLSLSHSATTRRTLTTRARSCTRTFTRAFTRTCTRNGC